MDFNPLATNKIVRTINGQEHVIATNGQLKAPFDTDDRYSMAASDNAVAFSEIIIESKLEHRKNTVLPQSIHNMV